MNDYDKDKVNATNNLIAAETDDYSLVNRFNYDENNMHMGWLSNSQYREVQEILQSHIFIFDDIDISKNFTDDVVSQLTSGPKTDTYGGNTKGWMGAWHPGIGYDWPVHEWAYPFRVEESYYDEQGEWEQWEWLDCPMKAHVMRIWGELSNYINNKFDIDIQVQEAHFNATAYGQEGKIHEDLDDDERVDSFVLMFLNDDMTAYDSGEFVTYKSLEQDLHKNKDMHKSEIGNIVNPKRARTIFSDSRLLHRGLPPSRLYPKTRFTIVFKTMTGLTKQEKFEKLGWSV